MERRTFVKSVLGGTAGTSFVGNASAESSDLDGSSDLLASSSSDPLDSIEILTDDYNESHIYADSVYGLGYANGYVQAGDRLFEMDVVRHIGYGNSAKVLGPAQIPSDIQVKRDLYSKAEIKEQWENAPETLKTAVIAFTDGVNRKMIELAAKGELPAEFAALGHAPEPWRPEDTVAAINYLIGFFGVSGGGELGNAKTLVQLRESLGSWAAAYETYEDVNWLQTRPGHFTSIPADDKVVEGGETVPDFEDVPDEQLAFVESVWTENADGEKEYGTQTWGIEADVTVPDSITEGQREGHGIMEGFKWGSNALVVSGDLTETGEPMLGGGPQTGFFKPPVPYEVGLHGDGFDCSGIGIVGTPAIVIGRNAGTIGGGDGDGNDDGKQGSDGSSGTDGGSAAESEQNRDALAYTVTSGRDDMVDTIALELDPDDKHRYKWEGDWYEMDTHQVTHYASPVVPTLGGDPKTRVVEQEVARVSPPGVDQDMPVIAWNPDPINFDHPVAWCQRIASRKDELDGASIWAEIGRVRDLDDFEDTFAEFPFTFNFHFVSDAGDIGYFHTGKVPLRGDGGGLDYRLPQTSTGHDWNGTFYTQQGAPTDPERQSTTIRNPSRGYVVNWNNGPAACWRAGDAEQNWGSIHRVDELNYWVREHLGVPEGVPDGKAVENAAKNDLTIEDIKIIISKAALTDASAQFSVPFFIDAARKSGDSQLEAMADELQTWLDSYCAWYDEEPAGADEDYYPPTHGADKDPKDPKDNDTYGDGKYIHAGHAIYDETRKRLQSRTFADELGNQFPTIDWEPAPTRHAGDHGRVGEDVTFYDALREATAHDWFDDVSTDETESRDEQIRAAMQEAAKALEKQFGTDDPSEWLIEVHTSKFLPIGATEMERIDMRNRSSYNQAIEIARAQLSPDAELDWTNYAGDVMPPSNSGHITGPELARAQATGTEPERLHDQLVLYATNQYKPHPVTREQVESVAKSRQTIRPTPERPDAPLIPVGSPPPETDADVLSHLVGGAPSGATPTDLVGATKATRSTGETDTDNEEEESTVGGDGANTEETVTDAVDSGTNL